MADFNRTSDRGARPAGEVFALRWSAKRNPRRAICRQDEHRVKPRHFRDVGRRTCSLHRPRGHGDRNLESIDCSWSEYFLDVRAFTTSTILLLRNSTSPFHGPRSTSQPLCASTASPKRWSQKAKTKTPHRRSPILPTADAAIHEEWSAVLISDHVTKSTETRGRWARGSSAKLGRYDGASYSAELVQAYSPTVAGKVRLRVSKDRNGGIGVAGQIVAEINFTPLEGTTHVAFQEPVEGKPFKPTAIMAKICEHLESSPMPVNRPSSSRSA